jgi:NitT/TauT family transport system substrate-binding protein
MAGWRAALKPENRSKAIEVLQRYDKDSTVAVLQEQLEITRGLIKPDVETEIGQIDAAAWQQTETIMLSQKQIDKPVNVLRALKQMPLR